ncbi:MAG: hypothetical protein WCV92_04625 [Candidatus Buchananbacteria bacterium]
MFKLPHKAWVVTVDMGYGHQRAAYPLKTIAYGKIITANNYFGIPKGDRAIWQGTRAFYEFISRFKRIPLIGGAAFDLYDKFQAIPDFYPKRDLSKSNLQLSQTYNLFKKHQWGKHLFDKLAKKPIPLVTTFFVTSMMAEYYNYPGDIYCILCDADISRTWVPPKPQNSRIIYLASNKRVEERLRLYGVRQEKIFLTGFPLPEENVGHDLNIIKNDLGERLIQLDPEKIYINQYKKTLQSKLKGALRLRPIRPITITFCVGGAGAQRELGVEIVRSLHNEIRNNKIKINLVAGINKEVAKFFREEISKFRLGKIGKKNIRIVFETSKQIYFSRFNRILRNTDILWTKPSELSFYCAMGLPIIIAPPIGSQELFNQKWLQSIGAGINQEDPRYTNEWLMDWINSGWLADAAMQGFTEAPKFGTYNVDKIVFHHFKETKKFKTVLQY